MSYHIIISAFASFIFIFVIQTIAARLFKPKSEDRFIIGLYVLLPMIIFLTLLILSSNKMLPALIPSELILTYLLFFVIASSWVASYPALYASSPSLVMIYLMTQQPQGTSLEDFTKWMSIKENSNCRRKDALNSGLICIQNDSIHLTFSGQTLFIIFSTYKKMLGLQSETL